MAVGLRDGGKSYRSMAPATVPGPAVSVAPTVMPGGAVLAPVEPPASRSLVLVLLAAAAIYFLVRGE